MAAGCIRERNGRFYVRVRVPVVDPQTGESRWKQIEKAAGSTRRDAQRLLRELQGDVEDGRYVPSDMSVLELGRRWLSEHVEANLKPGAAASYRSTFYAHVAPALGAVRVDDCGAQVVSAMLGRKRAEGVSEQGVAKIHRVLHAMFGFAQETGLMAVNPADGGRSPVRHSARRDPRGTQLSPAQLKRFLDACSPRWRPFFIIALDTGLRRGELIGLQWGDVDLLRRILHVRRSIGPYDDPENLAEKGSERLTTKTQAGDRLVPILEGAHRALEELYANAADRREQAPVFATVEAKRVRGGDTLPVGRPLSPRMVSSVFRRYAERAGLPTTIRLHDLRHTAITNAISQGEDALLISAFAGHANTSTTVDLYGHLMPNRVREAARRMRSVSGAPGDGAPGPEEGTGGPQPS